MVSFFHTLPKFQELSIEQDNARTHVSTIAPEYCDDETDYVPSKSAVPQTPEERVTQKKAARWECSNCPSIAQSEVTVVDPLTEMPESNKKSGAAKLRHSFPTARQVSRRRERRQVGELRSSLPMTCPQRQVSIDTIPDVSDLLKTHTSKRSKNYGGTQPRKAGLSLSSSPSSTSYRRVSMI